MRVTDMWNEPERSKASALPSGTVRAAIYCRLSKDDELQGESASIANQRSMLQDYCDKQGWEVIAVYQDDGFTGLNMDRPDFQKMLKAAEARMINLVITKDACVIIEPTRKGPFERLSWLGSICF